MAMAQVRAEHWALMRQLVNRLPALAGRLPVDEVKQGGRGLRARTQKARRVSLRVRGGREPQRWYRARKRPANSFAVCGCQWRELTELDAEHCPTQGRGLEIDRAAVQLNGLTNDCQA